MMNASIFEDTVGKSLVSLYAENMFMSYQGQFTMKKLWAHFTVTGCNDIVFEIRASPYSLDNIPYEDRWIMDVERVRRKPPTTVIFNFNPLKVTDIHYYTYQLEEENHLLGINEIDSVVLFDRSRNESILLGFQQFQVVSEVHWILGKKNIDRCLEDCTEIPRKIVASALA